MSDDEIYFGRSVTPSELVGIILMAQRVARIAKPGSLLKGERKPKEKRKLGQRLIKAAHEAQAIARGQANPKSYRVHRPDYLALIRRCPCLGCDEDPAGEAAHLRMSVPGKPNALGLKPADKWVLPLCPSCHRRQHAGGEAEFWHGLQIDPIAVAMDLSECRWIEDMRTVIFAAREKRK